MPHTPLSVLHKRLHERFREVFGAPHTTVGRDDHWSLMPDGHGRHALAINVLVNGMAQMPTVWVFDPNSRNDGVMTTTIKEEADIEEIIKKIQMRVTRANQSPA